MRAALRRLPSAAGARRRLLSTGPLIKSPPLVYIRGEEMTKYCMDLILEKWVEPRLDTSAWEFYDLSCVARDDSEDACSDAVAAGGRSTRSSRATVTPTECEEELGCVSGVRTARCAAAGTGSRSAATIHRGDGLGYKRPVLFERHAGGGGRRRPPTSALGRCLLPEGGAEVLIDERGLTDADNAVVTYHNPLDNVPDLARHFFSRCLEAEVVPYVVTKKTVFKWQEGFWAAMKKVFDAEFKAKYTAAGLLDGVGGELPHLISDAATMQIIRWTDGGFGMAAHNYDGDMLTDEVAQVHRSPGFITSNLIGKAADGSLIKEFEASHGTVADMWEAHLRGEETSLNPLGMAEALIGAIDHAADLAGGDKAITEHGRARQAIHTLMVSAGTRDLCGPSASPPSSSSTPSPASSTWRSRRDGGCRRARRDDRAADERRSSPSTTNWSTRRRSRRSSRSSTPTATARSTWRAQGLRRLGVAPRSLRS